MSKDNNFLLANDRDALKIYYANYLVDVRHLSQSSVKHYFDALNNISRRLKSKGLLEQDIYEIADIEQLLSLREILRKDTDFVAMDKRGNNMYSAGLNNYIRFAEGKNLNTNVNSNTVFDFPVEPTTIITKTKGSIPRSSIRRLQAIGFADYKCELNPKHQSFIAENTSKPYMEGHHLMPISQQCNFDYSLDVYANLICLCPICHRKIHYGLIEDRIELIKSIYDSRESRLKNSGIDMNKKDFVELVIEI